MSIYAMIQDGQLVLTADDESREELNGADYGSQLAHIAEELHEEFDFIAAEVTGSLTDAPMLAASGDLDHSDDNGEVKLYPDADFYYFGNYMIDNPFDILAETGQVEFSRA
jgi:hypothetical protein